MLRSLLPMAVPCVAPTRARRFRSSGPTLPPIRVTAPGAFGALVGQRCGRRWRLAGADDWPVSSTRTVLPAPANCAPFSIASKPVMGWTQAVVSLLEAARFLVWESESFNEPRERDPCHACHESMQTRAAWQITEKRAAKPASPQTTVCIDPSRFGEIQPVP